MDWDITTHCEFGRYSSATFDAFWESLEFQSIVETVSCRSIVGRDRLKTIFDGVRQTKHIAGAMAVLGVYRGGSTALVAASDPRRQLYAFDTFAGIPNAVAGVDGHQNGDFGDVVLEELEAFLLQYSNVKVVPGLFPETAAIVGDQKFSFAYFDADTYASALAFLNFFYPRMAPGGVMMFDDYGWHRCPGVARAIDEFFVERRELVVQSAVNQCKVTIDAQRDLVKEN